jgi:hypothetical protein
VADRGFAGPPPGLLSHGKLQIVETFCCGKQGAGRTDVAEFVCRSAR